MRYSQEQVGLKGDVREGPVHQDHLCVLNVFSELQQQEHSPAVQVWGKKPNKQKQNPCPTGASNLRVTPMNCLSLCETHRLCS